MKAKNKLLLKGILITCVLIIFLTTAVSAADEGLSIDWYTIDGGGTTSASGNYTLSGTIGQADAGELVSGDTYTISGGYWSRILTLIYNKVYLPLVSR